MNETTKEIIDNIFEELITLQESIDVSAVSVSVKAKEPAHEKVDSS